jgi:NAD(P)-dependent dehydrogenase (short-subunit alcohol dehydrogenase family)
MRTAAQKLEQYGVRVNAMWSTALTRMTEDLPGMAGAGEETMGPQLAPAVPVFLASDEAEGVTGCTLGTVSGNVACVSDPARERSPKTENEDGKWTAAELAGRREELTEGFETRKLDAGY